jgi:hypothetical protein
MSHSPGCLITGSFLLPVLPSPKRLSCTWKWIINTVFTPFHFDSGLANIRFYPGAEDHGSVQTVVRARMLPIAKSWDGGVRRKRINEHLVGRWVRSMSLVELKEMVSVVVFITRGVGALLPLTDTILIATLGRLAISPSFRLSPQVKLDFWIMII